MKARVFHDKESGEEKDFFVTKIFFQTHIFIDLHIVLLAVLKNQQKRKRSFENEKQKCHRSAGSFRFHRDGGQLGRISHPSRHIATSQCGHRQSGDIFPIQERQGAIGTFMGISFLGQGLSMVIGGTIAYFLSWRGVFGLRLCFESRWSSQAERPLPRIPIPAKKMTTLPRTDCG